MRKFILLLSLFSSVALGEIAPEPLGVVQKLPEQYPPHWILVQDGSFFHMNDGKFIVIDADSDDPAARFKGMFNGSLVPQFVQSRTRPEMYVTETFYSRNNRGERTDALTIYDKATLSPVAEVVIPPKRALSMPTHYHVQLIAGDSLALIYNFTPAASVSVVDLDARKFLAEIAIPGCALVFPMAGRAFASLCGDGAMLRVEVAEDGTQASAERTQPFFDTLDDPLMEKPALIDGVAYFPTFLGNLVAVDLNGSMPVVKDRWSLVAGIEGDWRPGGVVLAGSDAKGRLYVLMHSGGYDGSHKDPGTEVWVFDPREQKLLTRIQLAQPAIAMALTNDDDPLLVTTNVNMEVDVYDADEGRHMRTIGNFGQETPFVLHGAGTR